MIFNGGLEKMHWRESWIYEGIMEQVWSSYIWFSMNERFIPVLYYNTHFQNLIYVPMVLDLSILCVEKPLFSLSEQICALISCFGSFLR